MAPKKPQGDLFREASTPARDAPAERVLSVGQLGRLLKSELETGTAGLAAFGEIVGLKLPDSGHAYFTLRDEEEEAAIDCVMYRTAPVRAKKLLAEGARLVLNGRVTFWAPRGRVQMVVEGARVAGRGALLEALEKLKTKLAAEGLFAPERKRRLPREPRAIGLVTSGQGAALHDIVKVAWRRARVRFILVTAPVQGAGAGEALARALRLCAKHPEVDTIVLGRGGGSQDDLAAFNDEALVRAVAACRVPVVTAVGHETDLTLVDLAADVRASTPSQAAELAVPDAAARLAELRQHQARMERALTRALSERSQHIDVLCSELTLAAQSSLTDKRHTVTRLSRRLSARHPAAVLARAQGELGPLTSRLERAMRRTLAARSGPISPLLARVSASMERALGEARTELADRAARLDALSPLAVLGRGYAIARRSRDRHILTRPDEAPPGERIEIRLSDGQLFARVEPAPRDD